MSAYSAQPVVPKRLIWPWVLGAVLVAVGSVIVFAASFALSSVLAAVSDTRAEAVVRQTVLAFDAAYEDQDCAAFQALVDADLADQLVDGDFDCDSWVEVAESLRRDGEYAYSVEVLDVRVYGDDASARTEEDAGGNGPLGYYYTLEHGGDGWVIVAYGRT